MTRSTQDLTALVAATAHLDGHSLLARMLTQELPREIAVVSSFGAESAVLLALVADVDPSTPIVFLDTLKLFGETKRYRDQLAAHLGLTDIRVITPDANELTAEDRDDMLWQRDPDACCALRKVRPLDRALALFTGWVNGRKRYQSSTRSAVPTVELSGSQLKLTPLANWSADDIEAEFVRRALPRHPLVADGYRSIGCYTCTERVAEGEDARAGRWAGTGKTECGIHLPRNPQVLVPQP